MASLGHNELMRDSLTFLNPSPLGLFLHNSFHLLGLFLHNLFHLLGLFLHNLFHLLGLFLHNLFHLLGLFLHNLFHLSGLFLHNLFHLSGLFLHNLFHPLGLFLHYLFPLLGLFLHSLFHLQTITFCDCFTSCRVDWSERAAPPRHPRPLCTQPTTPVPMPSTLRPHTAAPRPSQTPTHNKVGPMKNDICSKLDCCGCHCDLRQYRKISNIRRAKSQNLNVSRLAVVFAQYIEVKCEVENKDVVGAAPTGDAPTTSGWSTI